MTTLEAVGQFILSMTAGPILDDGDFDGISLPAWVWHTHPLIVWMGYAPTKLSNFFVFFICVAITTVCYVPKF